MQTVGMHKVAIMSMANARPIHGVLEVCMTSALKQRSTTMWIAVVHVGNGKHPCKTTAEEGASGSVRLPTAMQKEDRGLPNVLVPHTVSLTFHK